MPFAGEASFIMPSIERLAQGNQRSQFPPAASRMKRSIVGDVQASVREFALLDHLAFRIKIRTPLRYGFTIQPMA
jgi:hypothetical protein